MHTYLDRLRANICTRNINDKLEFEFWLFLAAELAAMGERGELDKWQEHASRLNLDVESTLHRIGAENYNSLIESFSSSEVMGDELIKAQRCSFFLHFEGSKLSAKTQQQLNTWVAWAADLEVIPDQPHMEVNEMLKHWANIDRSLLIKSISNSISETAVLTELGLPRSVFDD